MKVALVTTWGERCGIAEYAKELVASCPGVEFKIIGRPWEITQVLRESASCSIVHFNYEPGLLGHIDAVQIAAMKAMGKKTVLTLHTSHDGDNRTPFTTAFDRTVVHEKTQEGFTFIPNGIPDFRPNYPGTLDALGTAGFPFPWKGFEEVAKAAQMLGKTAIVVAPDSRHWDTWSMKECVKKACPTATYVTEWLETKEVIERLAVCSCLVFAYQGGNYGISGAVRMGLATGRPVVLSRCRQFRDLFEYDDEIGFTRDCSAAAIVEAVQDTLATGKRPKRVLQDMSWKRCGELYMNVYKDLLGENRA